MGTWGGPEEARTAARCLEALCSFSPGAAVWRRLLPGTFSGLFRTIRGVRGESGAGSGGGGTAPLGFIRAGPQGVLGGGRRGGGGGSKSALAEACLEILAKVLVMCCGGGEAAAAIPPSAAPGDSKDNTSTTTDSNNPLLALQRLAVNSNASSRATQSEPTSTTSAGHPAGSTAAAAAAATVIAVDDPQWESRTSDRLRLLLPPLLAFCCLHPGWLVRRATARLASDLLLAGCKGGGEGGEGEGLLGPLAPLLMEALVGLLLDGMPQVSDAVGYPEQRVDCVALQGVAAPVSFGRGFRRGPSSQEATALATSLNSRSIVVLRVAFTHPFCGRHLFVVQPVEFVFDFLRSLSWNRQA